MRSERRHGLSTEPVSVSAYVGCSKNLEDLKHGLSTEQFPVSAYVGSSKNLQDLKEELNDGMPWAFSRLASS